MNESFKAKSLRYEPNIIRLICQKLSIVSFHFIIGPIIEFYLYYIFVSDYIKAILYKKQYKYIIRIRLV